MIDSTDRERLHISKSELYNMLSHEVSLTICIVDYEYIVASLWEGLRWFMWNISVTN